MLIGERLRELCARSELSLHDLEDTAGFDVDYLSRVIEGEEVPTCEILGRLAVALEVPLARLFCDEGELVLSPRLAPRPTIKQLAEDHSQRRPLKILDGIVVALKLRRLLGPP